jgi:mono/diheme cytochrome c family protein
MKRLALLGIALLLCGCEQKMAEMPRVDPLETSQLFADGAGARVPVTGTIAADADIGPQPTALPAALDLDLMQRGQQRFNIFCSPCHGRTGDGDGMVVQRGFPKPPSYHQDALRKAPDRHFYDVITNGYGAMYSYAARVPPHDRWAIVAYIRTLQYSRYAPVAALPEELRAKLDAEATQ